MKKYSRVFHYISQFKSDAFLYITFTVLAIIFSIVSLGTIFPFLELVVSGKENGFTQQSNNPIVSFVRNFLTTSIDERGKVSTLAIVCLFIVVSIFLKNLFLYLASYVLNPLKNKIVNRFRVELYDKVLHLPISFFTEKRKGDIISRITNDVSEVENSVVGTLEGWIRDPLAIIFTLVTLLLISVPLTLFVLVCIPIVGLVIGRITRSLRRQSAEVANRSSESLSVLDETLSGLRVIKAFNSEALLRSRFFRINDDLVTAKNKIGYRRDLASPVSEFLGVLIFVAILFFGGQLVSGLIQEEINTIFQRMGMTFVQGSMVSVSSVKVTPDLLEARIYLSIFNSNPAAADPKGVLKKIEERHWEIKRELASHVKHQLRRIPELKFFLDDTLDQVFKMEELFRQIKPQSPEGEEKDPA